MSDDADIPRSEKFVMAVSVLFTVALFAFAGWHAVTGPGATAPTVHVTESEATPDGVRFAVEFRNPGDVGFVSASIQARCTDPPTVLTVEHVPAGGHRTGTVVCPPGTTDPSVTVVTWVQE